MSHTKEHTVDMGTKGNAQNTVNKDGINTQDPKKKFKADYRIYVSKLKMLKGAARTKLKASYAKAFVNSCNIDLLRKFHSSKS